jgi:hypothetical protein
MAEVRRALVIAVGAHENAHLRALAAPAADAHDLAEVLADPAGAAFDVETLADEPSYVLRQRVETFLSSRRSGDMTLLHIMCTGLVSDRRELYLAATDTRPEFPASSALDAAFVDRCLRRCRARRALLLLDCRYGGAYMRGRVPPSPVTIDLAHWFGQRGLADGRGRAFIATAGVPTFTFEERELLDASAVPPQRLTAALADGLRAHRIDRDGQVTPAQAHAYLSARTGEPHPHLWTFGPQDGLALVADPQAATPQGDAAHPPPRPAAPPHTAPGGHPPRTSASGPPPVAPPGAPSPVTPTGGPPTAYQVPTTAPTAGQVPRPGPAAPPPPQVPRRPPPRRGTRGRPTTAWTSVPTTGTKIVYAVAVLAVLAMIIAVANVAGGHEPSGDDGTIRRPGILVAGAGI